jgi:four helix bundle protein
MLNDFHAFVLAKNYYQLCKPLKLPEALKNQLTRASSSIALNLAEGSGKRTAKDQIRFYSMALGSLRECQAVLALEEINHPELQELGARLGTILFKLSRITPNPTKKTV